MRPRPLLAAAALALAPLALAACGSDKPAATPTTAAGGRVATVSDGKASIDMKYIAFEPTELNVKAGEKVTLTFHNTGKVLHEALIGDKAMQAQHEKDMANTSTTMMSGMDSSMGHDMGSGTMGSGGHMGEDSMMVRVEPGKTGTLAYTFTAKDDGTIIGCHQPGHYKAGMLIKINVT